MCYDIKASLESQLVRATRSGDLQAIEEIREQLAPLTDLPIYHASAFNHPELLIYTDRSPEFPEVATWGLVPEWVGSQEQQKKIWNSTVNARGETIFEKASFKNSALHQRCIIYIDGFYEHHHFMGKTYPFYIQPENSEPLALAGLWNPWINPETKGKFNTFTVVTTKGTSLLAKIHNNPKLQGPRMPLMLSKATEEQWLAPLDNTNDIEGLKQIIKENSANITLKAHPVGRLRGKAYKGNVEGVSTKLNYPELVF